MALSKRDWNNVIIFSVLAMLLLFFLIPQQLMEQQQSPKAQQQLVTAEQPLLQLQFESTSLQQAGTEWRFQPALTESSLSPVQLAQYWQQLQLPAPLTKKQAAKVELGSQPLRRVVLLLAGAEAPQHWWLFQQQQQFYLQRQGMAAIYPLTAEQADQLMPAELNQVVE